mmetsp:Transcript_148148/g.369360  ORF Transcript_148148/g.369360 Transcript_148148/m.369360 type:complete len:231 (-) Transcript_148148:136-828(-)
MGFVMKPAPSVFGTCSLTAAFEMVCLVHLCVCLFFVASVSSSSSTVLAGVEISPEMQCITAAWFLIGLPVVIYAGVGALFRVESHLSVYLAYQLGTLLVVVLWTVIFLKYGNACTEEETMDIGPLALRTSAIVCTVSNGMVLFWMVALGAGVVAAIYLAWSMKVYIRNRTETELLRYQEPWQMVQSLADDAAAEQARAAEQLSGAYAAMGPYGGKMAYAQPVHHASTAMR